MKKETELEKLGLGFLGRIMHMHEQAYVHRQDYAYVGSTLESLAKNIATQKIKQDFKTIILTT